MIVVHILCVRTEIQLQTSQYKCPPSQGKLKIAYIDLPSNFTEWLKLRKSYQYAHDMYILSCLQRLAADYATIR